MVRQKVLLFLLPTRAPLGSLSRAHRVVNNIAPPGYNTFHTPGTWPLCPAKALFLTPLYLNLRPLPFAISTPKSNGSAKILGEVVPTPSSAAVTSHPNRPIRKSTPHPPSNLMGGPPEILADPKVIVTPLGIVVWFASYYDGGKWYVPSIIVSRGIRRVFYADW